MRPIDQLFFVAKVGLVVLGTLYFGAFFKMLARYLAEGAAW